MSAHDRRPPYYLGIDLGGTNIKSGVVDDGGGAALVGEPGNRGRPADQRSASPSWPKRAVAASRPADCPGTGLPGSGSARRAQWTSRGMLLEPPNLPGWNHLPIRDRLRRSWRSRRSFRTTPTPRPMANTGPVRTEHSQPRTLHAGHGNRLRNRRRGPDHRGPAQPWWRVRPHHHPMETAVELVRRLRAPRGLCLGHRPCEAGRPRHSTTTHPPAS